jgi:hypothetical protein
VYVFTGFESRGESIFTGDLTYGPTKADESRHSRLDTDPNGTDLSL